MIRLTPRLKIRYGLARVLCAFLPQLAAELVVFLGAENSVVNRVFTRVTLISAIFETDSSVGATPSFSVDTKKRELVGDFKNPGMRWDLSPRPGDCGKRYGPSEIAA